MPVTWSVPIMDEEKEQTVAHLTGSRRPLCSHLCELCVKSFLSCLSPRSRRFKSGKQLQNAALGGVRKRQQRRTRRAPTISALIHHKLHAGNPQLGNDQFRRAQQILLQLPRRIQLSPPRHLIKLRELLRQSSLQ